MSRPVWVGSLSFGLVTLPVRVHGAVVSRQVQFHLLHDADGARIQNKRVCAADGEEVPLEHVVRGYTLADGRSVTVTSGELDALEPVASQVIALESFVDPARVDDLLVDTSYHLVPARGAEHAHALLAAGLRESGRVGVGRWVLYQKGHLCLVRPHGRGLVLSTLHAVDEVVSQERLSELEQGEPALEPGELAATLRLIEARSADFDPQSYPDVHRERVKAFLERRARAQARTRTRRAPPEVAPREPEAGPLPGALARGVDALRAGPPPPMEGALRLRPRMAAREVRERSGDTSTRGPEGPSEEEESGGGEPSP
ncbi:non-homologous end joining protein Ku [Myxococcus qinghaiensis]|uniref:non-homologous end joining protein Ku n=1 Tax=Myxococcus qinghaiensis TaxID=2906758 RepID=UPI0020A77EF0|nr:Ku protein [Myxococcus qinghaiensis]MCP3164657.1 Ku protein [Myxococcus qinghaiensis]